jgi:hypothetical protein
MMGEEKAVYRPGDWVQIAAQVAVAERSHPEDVVVELFSHNEQYAAAVRRDRVVRTAPPAFAMRCTRLYQTPKAVNDELIRCRLHENHADEHSATASDGAPWTWPEEASVGYMEDR